ncbi:protein adenylyltransferase SelO [Aquamicrobium sp. LC103]|uniref:protein adenylyltransferase SelO n=1 Tax=Aquamicrobium sp. LC103 TaxID=1120658 RepID=UPI00063E854E|nr:YdiU family protein [Aquamicrobium sp. LC103]TKT74731.1 YdiU family protein [Aquamicrobium sp. LC103]
MSGPVFSNSYAALPERFYVRTSPTPVREPRLIHVNEDLARELGLDLQWISGREGAELFAGNKVPESAQPIALAYAGHQFGQFVPQLGDGRAVLLGELFDSSGRRRDVQLKGSGPTYFSRGGDGRAAIGPVLREYIVSEAMAALGIPTTRTLAAATTGEPVYRETRLPGAVVTRVAASHIRIGTFQFFAARGDTEAVRALADHAIARHYPHLSDDGRPYLGLFSAVVSAQADLVAKWMLVGFIHGVMNTDNMTISGETIDYGPCAFMDVFDPGTVFSSIDHFGRYAYANQPYIAQWNLARLAETLLPLIADDKNAAIADAEAVLDQFPTRFENAFRTGMRRKLGLEADRQGDIALARNLLDVMARNKADFTLTFRALGNDLEAAAGEGMTRSLFAVPEEFDAWAREWRARLAGEPMEPAARKAAMQAVNPKYIPRNHRVEAVVEAAAEHSDFAPFEELLSVVTKPFEEQPGMERYAEAPAPDERVLQTFCGT